MLFTPEKRRYVIPFVLTALILICGFTSCAKSSERKEILDFMNNSDNQAAMEKALAIEDDWNAISAAKSGTYTRAQLINEIGLLEQRSGLAYQQMAEVIPPKCLRSFWDKEVEACKLYFQSISLMYSLKDDPSASAKQINELIFKANDLKTVAQREFQDICEKNNIKTSW